MSRYTAVWQQICYRPIEIALPQRVNTGVLVPTEDAAAILEVGKNMCVRSQAYGDSYGGRP